MGVSRGNITTNIIKAGLVFNMDAANRASYPKTGTTITNTIPNQTGTTFLTGTINGSTFLSTFKGILNFDGGDDYLDFGTPSELVFASSKNGRSISCTCYFPTTKNYDRYRIYWSWRYYYQQTLYLYRSINNKWNNNIIR